MKTLTMKKLSLAVLTAACVLGLGVAEAAPKVSLKVITPVGTAAADKAVAGKGMPWSTCITNTAGSGSFGGLPVVSTLDRLQFDIDVTNADDDKDTAKLMDYDLYVFFIDYSTTSAAAATASVASPGNTMYAMVPATGLGGPGLVVISDTLAGTTSPTGIAALTPSSYRFMANTDFGTSAGFKNTLFGSAISLDQVTPALSQGLWSVMAVMTRPGGVQSGGTLPSPAVVAGAVDPTTVATPLPGAVSAGAPVTIAAVGSLAIQNPSNWAAWAIQPFILGTPFKTTVGIGTAGAPSVIAGGGSAGFGKCS